MIRTVPREARPGRSSLRSRLAGAGLALVLVASSALVVAPAASAVEQPFAVSSPQNGSSVSSTTPTFSGTGTTGNTVTLTYSGQQLLTYTAGTAIVDDAGNWSTPTSFGSANPGETETRVVATETTPAGVPTSAGFGITINFPTAPVPAAVFTLESPTEGETRSDLLNIVNYLGTGNPGNTITVRYFANGGLAVAGTGTVNPDGRFNVLATFNELPAGQDFANTFTLQTTPAGDRVSNELGRNIFFTVPPVQSAPFIVSSPQNGSTVNTATPAFTGSGAAGDTVEITYSGQRLGTYIAGTTIIPANGQWTIPTTDFSNANFGETAISVGARAVSPAGVERPGRVGFLINFAEAPVPVTEFTLATPEEGATVGDPREGVSFVGTGEPGNTIVVQYFKNGGGLKDAGTATVDEDGNFEVVALFDELPDAGLEQPFANTFTQQLDADGNTVAREISRLIYFTEVPVVVPLDAPTLNAPVVDGTTVTFSGTGTAGATLEVAVTDAAVATTDATFAALLAAPATLTTTVDVDGNWTVSDTFEPGNYSATASQFTGDGADRSAPTAAREFTVAAIVTPVDPGTTNPGAGLPPTSGTPTGNTSTGANAPGGLAATGADSTGTLALAMLLVGAGAVAFVARRRTALAKR